MGLFINPRSSGAEAFRTLRTSLHYTADRESCRVILITSVGPGDGKTMTSSNLATSMAQAGDRVLLIDGDLRKPRCHRLFGVSNRRGLTNVLVDSVDMTEVVRESQVPGLSLLTSGPIPPNPAELLDSKRMEEVLQQARDSFDRVLVDTAPAGPVADASILASKVDGVILVIVSGQTRVDQANEVKDTLTRARGRMLGVVLNKARLSSSDYHYRYYYEEERGRTPENSGRTE